MTPLTGNVQWALAGVYAVSLFASLVVWFLTRANPERDGREIVQRVKSWWVIAIIFSLAMVLRRVTKIEFPGDGGVCIEASSTVTGTVDCTRDGVGNLNLISLLSRNTSIAFMGFVSFLALNEYPSLVPTRRADRRVLLWIYLVVPIQYYWIADQWYGMFIIFVPV